MAQTRLQIKVILYIPHPKRQVEISKDIRCSWDVEIEEKTINSAVLISCLLWEMLSPYTEIRGAKEQKKAFLFYYSYRGHLEVCAGARYGSNNRYIMLIPFYKSQYERWNFSLNMEELGAGEISYLYTFELKWLGSIYIVSL